MRKHFSLGIVLTAVVFVAFLAACGSSGGGGGLTDYYNGEVGAAAIENTTDAEAIVSEAFGSSKDMSEATGFIPVTGLGARALSLSKEALTAEASMGFKQDSDPNCSDDSGYMAVTVTQAGNSGSASVKFVEYCETTLDGGEEYMNGSISLAVSDFDAATGDPKNLTFTLPSLRVQAYDISHNLTDDVSMSGKLTAKVDFGTITITSHITQNMTAKDNIGGESFKVKDYDITIVQTTDEYGFPLYEDVTIASGTFYHSAHGYVSIKTTTPLRENAFASNPTSGVIVLTGANDSSLTLDFNTGDPTTADLYIDFDGDGTDDEGPLTVELDADYHGTGVPSSTTEPPAL